GSGAIAEAWLIAPTARYAHFVLGARYEAGGLAVRTRAGAVVTLILPEDEVFEDRQPRLADLDGDGEDEIVLVKSHLRLGAALAAIALSGGRLGILAETPPIGRPNAWLNPAGIADFDGDGRADIAVVQQPHVLGLLRVWSLRGGRLVEIASLPDVSNHVIGSPALGLSAVADFDGDGIADLALPSRDRGWLRFLSFAGGVREIARRRLPAPAASDFELDRGDGKPGVIVGLADGRRIRVLP
ncbi:MAG: VCBS repeat-containing protein, partial [Alphaproteobacteria bacterium]|nr:VCBS repeat-containing protein [Alphaproteobacteria bacterium]